MTERRQEIITQVRSGDSREIYYPWSIDRAITFDLARQFGLKLPTGTFTSKLDNVIRTNSIDFEFGNKCPAFLSNPGTHEYDLIVIPPPVVWESEGSFRGRLAHELCHWAESYIGVKRKPNKDESKAEYARYEVSAELGALFIMDELREGFQDNIKFASSYINNWCDDGNLVNEEEFIEATKRASKLADYVLQFTTPRNN
jgi:antirestriction protein ArdC